MPKLHPKISGHGPPRFRICKNFPSDSNVPTMLRNNRQTLYLGKQLRSRLVNTSVYGRAAAWALCLGGDLPFQRQREGHSHLCVPGELIVLLQLSLITSKSQISFFLFICLFFISYILDLVLFLCLQVTENILNKFVCHFFFFILVIELSTLVYQSQSILIQTDFLCPSEHLSHGGLVDARR